METGTRRNGLGWSLDASGHAIAFRSIVAPKLGDHDSAHWDSFRALAEGSVQGVCIQRGSRVLFANAAMATMLGYSGPTEVAALDVLGAFEMPSDGLDGVALFDATASGDSLRSPLEARLRRSDGSRAWVECLPKAVDWFGEPAVLVTAIDVSDRKRAEENLRRAYAEITELKAWLQAEDACLQQENPPHGHFAEIIGTSTGLCEALTKVERVAATTTTVLVLGETGTGKELLARAIHRVSPRAGQPFIGLNCAAIPEQLVETELLGHERGAFTGASSTRRGRFELADDGTLFLDEIGELPLAAQAKLLRILQFGEFERVGGSVTVKVDVRIVAATHRDLRSMVREGKFRDDLFYRLSVFPLRSPPLRERIDDIPLLAKHFLRRHAERLGKTFKGFRPGVLDRLRRHAWPGNIRELENVIERAVILSDPPIVDVCDDAFQSTSPRENGLVDATLGEVEREMIVRAVEASKGRVEGRNGAAARLGLPPSTLRGRIRKLGITRVRRDGGPFG